MPSVAVVGASRDRSKFGNKSVRAHLRQGWTVYPVHPTETEIEGLAVYRAVRDVPRPLDRITVYVPPWVGETLVEDWKAAGARELFLNPGSESDRLVALCEKARLDPLLACSIVDIGESPGAF